MFNLDDILKGYSAENYANAVVETLTQLLISKSIISADETKEYFKNNFNKILEQVIEEERKECKKRIKELEEKLESRNK